MNQLNVNKIVESFNKLGDQARYCLLVGAVFLIILLDVVLLTLPQLGAIAGINDQIKKMADDTKQVDTDRGRIKILRKNLQDSRDQLKALNAKIRPVSEVPAILSNISNVANQFGVKIEQMIPQRGMEQNLKTTPDGKYDGLPVVIHARSSYHNFGHFLNTLENSDLFFIVKDFIIQDDEKNPNSHLYSLTIMIVLIDKNFGISKSL